MTQDEKNMLSDLASKIAQTPNPPRDPEAEDFIRKNIGARPDALYLMTQTVLIQNMALQQSQRQIQDLQQRMSQPVQQQSYAPSGGGSFLGQSAPPPQYAQYQSAPVPAAPSATSSFLRNAAQTAAGVAAGTLAVQGIESLFSHHSGFGGFGGGGGEGFLGSGGGIGGYGGGETIIENNYYGDDRDASSNDDSNLTNADYDDNDTSGDTLQADDSNYDDSSSNDDNFA